MEDYIPISYLNDFIFCPRSIYFHQLFGRRSTYLYQDSPQTEGKVAHKAVDNQTYSTRKTVLQGLEIYCDKYRICCIIDIYYADKKILVERKKMIKTIYDGYYFQLYAQYFAMEEMGYEVRKIQFYSMDTNKNYPIYLPQDNPEMLAKFEETIEKINSFKLSDDFTPNPKKCQHCIYEPLCDVTLC